MKSISVVLSVLCFAIMQPELLKGQGSAQFQADCATCHALPGTGSGPALSSTVGLRRGGWVPLVATMDQKVGPSQYHFSADIAAIGAYLESLYPIASPSTLPAGAARSVYGPVAISGIAGSPQYTFSASGLPSGLTISPSGSLSGTPGSSTQGSYNILFTMTDSTSACVAPYSTCPYSGTFTRTMTIGAGVHITGPSGLPSGILGAGFGPVTFSAGGGSAGYTWAASGLPPGINFSSAGVLTGTPTATGLFNPQFTVNDSTNATSSVNLYLTVNTAAGITSPLSLSAGVVGVAYSPVNFAANGGTGIGYTWSASGLPAGMSIDPLLGVLGGTPTAVGTFTPQFIATDSASATFSLSLPLTINPAGCTYALSGGGQAFGPAGGSGNFAITAPVGCVWSLAGVPTWVTFNGAMSGSGNGSIGYQVSANTGGDQTATLAIGGLLYTIEQQGTVTGLNPIGSLAHLLAEENWTTSLTLVNKGAADAQARLSIFSDAGAGAIVPLQLPLLFPQQPGAAGPLLASSFDRTIAANASLLVTTSGPQTPPVQVGSVQLAATGPVDGFAIFHHLLTTQEAVVPLETRNASSYLLAFDNTNGLVLGVALENVSAQDAAIPVVIRDEAGNIISEIGATVSLAANGHKSFVLSTQFSITANGRGTIEFDTPAGGQISVLGLRFSPPNNALTTIPALANVGAGGGSIAHFASGGDGWQTTFVLINAGTTGALMRLSFYNDGGNLMQLPLANTMASSVSKNLAPGATLVISPIGSTNLLTGSAQLVTVGQISGFVIFRHNNQEAVVPLESRNKAHYIIAFDNTGGTATGIAVNVVSPLASTGQVNVPVTVLDDTGRPITVDTLNLAANGHLAFTLDQKYPGTANMRGTIEFDAPSGVQIGALGIRMPIGAAHAYTTLPSLGK